MAIHVWENTNGAYGTKNYTCPYCGKDIATNQHFNAKNLSGAYVARISICHYCMNPTYFSEDGKQIPGNPVGRVVEGIEDKNIVDLYSEARNTLSVSAYTASILCSRKLLMNIAVSKGADTNKTFQYYVDYLCDKNYVPPESHDWIDHIRNKGNEATHEINIMTKEDAEELIKFIEMILIFIWEFPFKVRRPVQ
jgi:hypothetical protein